MILYQFDYFSGKRCRMARLILFFLPRLMHDRFAAVGSCNITLQHGSAVLTLL